MKSFIEHLQNNVSIKTLDFSDNDLNDTAGTIVLAMIKKLSEQRNNEIWSKGLRNCPSKKSFVQDST